MWLSMLVISLIHHNIIILITKLYSSCTTIVLTQYVLCRCLVLLSCVYTPDVIQCK